MKKLLLGLSISVLWCTAALAQVSVVKVINFTCAICRASDSQDPYIKASVEKAGGKLAYAAMPSEETQGIRELYYYAARNKMPDMDTKFRQALFKGSQDLNMPLQDIVQLNEFFAQEFSDSKSNWSEIGMDAASGTEPKQSLGRALKMIVQSGAQRLPTYIVLSGTQIMGVLDQDTAGKTGSLIALREAVVDAVNQQTAKSTKK